MALLIRSLTRAICRHTGRVGGRSDAIESIKIELARGDLTAKNMDIIVNLFEVPPGATVPKHTHPGEEIVYVIDNGGTIREPDGTLVTLEAGAALICARGVPHAGFTNAGNGPLKMLNVFVVDKGKHSRSWSEVAEQMSSTLLASPLRDVSPERNAGRMEYRDSGLAQFGNCAPLRRGSASHAVGRREILVRNALKSATRPRSHSRQNYSR